MPFARLEILRNEQLAPDIFSLTAASADKAEPGQFYMLRHPDGGVLLPRAISVCDAGEGFVRFLVQRVGRGTGELAALPQGGRLSATGPLGNGFPVKELTGRIALVGGGIGVAPLLYTAKALRQREISADCFAGFRDVPYLHDELAEAVQHLHIASESGAAGMKGYVTGLLRPEEYDAVLCCGPTPMLRATTELCKAAGVPVYLSLENRMACGLGACLVCTCTVKGGENRRVCKDGPVFRGEDVDFDA